MSSPPASVADMAAVEAAQKAIKKAEEEHAQIQAIIDAATLGTLYQSSSSESNHTTHENPVVLPPLSKSKRKPAVDPDLLPSHEAFIAALTPIPIDSIIKNDRKCPHCWRIYGEPDPGEDNAEDPVRLPCGHEFGEQCALRLFHLPEAVKIILQPLSYEDGSRGADLGRRLVQYVQDESSTFVQAKNVNSPTKRPLPSLRSSARLKGKSSGDSSFTPTEDAVKSVLTGLLRDIRKPSKRHRTALETLGYEWHSVFEAASFHNQTLRSVHFLENGIIYDVNVETPPPYVLEDYPQSFYYSAGDFSSSTIVALPEASGPPHSFISQQVFDTASSHAAPTSTSEVQNKDLAQEKLGMMTAVAKLQSQLHSLEELVKNDAGSGQTAEFVKSMEDLKSEMLELNSKAEEVTSKISLSSSSNSTSPSAAAPKASSMISTSATLTLASAVSASRRSHQDEAQKRAEESMIVLASALVEVYNEYRRRHPEQIHPIAVRKPSSSPPLKKQKPSTLADTLDDNISRKQLNINVRVHTKGLKTKHYEVIQARSSFDDYSDDEEEEQVPNDQGEASLFIMKRSICGRTCCVKDGKSSAAAKLQMKAEIPTSIGWKDFKNIPNDCPKCRRLLFKMDRPNPNGDSDGITAMQTYGY